MSTTGLHNESVGYNGGATEQDGPPPPPPQSLPTSQSNIQLGVTCKVVTGGRGHTATVYPDSSAIPGVPVDAPLTVKQHFQQQRKQQKNRARESKRDTRRQAPANTTVTSVPIQSQGSLKDEKVTGIGTDPKILHPTRALSEPAFLNQHQLHQARPSTSKSADQDILRNTNMKIDPRLLGCFSAEDCAIVHGTVTSKESLCSPTKVPIEIGAESALESSLRSTLDSSMQSYDPPFHLSGSKTEQKLDDMLVRNEGVRNDFIQYPSIKCENLLSHSLTVHPNDNSGLGGCGTMDFSNVYSSVDGLDMPTVQGDNGMACINGTLEQNHTDADPTSFDQGVEKLDTETDERFLSWLYCENEHAEDDNAEYTRVLEEIEKDECYTHKLEDSQGPDFGVSSCIPSTSRDDSFGKAELDFSHSLPPDLVAGDYTSGQPTLQQRDTLPENYPMSDFDSDLELDVMAIREDEETLYGRLLDVLVRDIKLLTYNNAALVDEVSRLNYAIFVASEERKMLARRSCHHDRNRIRRLQTANKRKSDAQRRQQEQLTLAETQENIAQIKAKMAKTIASPQKVQTKPSMCSASSRPTLDVAAIKRSVEAEQRALEEKNLSRKPKKVGSSKFHRKRHERSRSERKRTYPSATAAKRGRSELGQRGQATVSSEGNSPVTSESVHPARKSIRGPVSGSEVQDDPDRKIRKSSQTFLSREGGSADTAEESDEASRYATASVGADQKPNEGCTDMGRHTDFANDENETTKNSQSHLWRRRAGRPPARAASAAAQTLLAAELAASVDPPPYLLKRTIRSRSNTTEPDSYRPPRKRVVPQSQHAQEQQSDDLNRMVELNIDVSDEVALEVDSELDHKYEVPDEELTPLGDVTGSEDSPVKAAQPIRSRRSTRTSSRQSIGDSGDGMEFADQRSFSPLHDESGEKSEEPVSMATRSHGRATTVPSSQSDRQMRERKQPTVYSPVARNTPTSQIRAVKKKS